ncbi:MAG: MoaD/ThiS family protein [Planctomycetia bacterium]|nr:MoaD/ThiS family protein [Planctomycetia bacterium]
MKVHFCIPRPLRPLTGGQSRVDVETPGRTLQDAFEVLFALYPGIHDRILDEKNEFRQHVNVFIGNTESRTLAGLATPLAPGTEISIIPAISGG